MNTASKASKGLSLAFFLNLFFAIIELIGGILTNSTAIIADAFHDFMDAVAIGVAVYMDKFSRKPKSSSFSYGYRRFSLLSAIIMSGILLAGAVLMIVHAVQSFDSVKEVNSIGMFGLAVLGIAINGFAFLKIKKGGTATHHHAHSHVTRDANSTAVMLHLLEDVLGWIAVLVGSIIIYFTQWYYIDGVLTLGIALFIGYNAFKNLWKTFKVLLQAVPEGIAIETIHKEIENLPEVTVIRELFIWTMDGQNHIATLEIETEDLILEDRKHLMKEIRELFDRYHIHQVTIQIN
ncbi:cation diffusion facilitator family transporter [Flavobacterium dauae]|uniref:cation diffusion facilitator family transporter n=1 Tax=Flavobacterium dauae TaxID=1563479 RepID=UPI00101B493C|nr:cation diffusion facilitator family transporter [Flavobacterium dauae]WLD23021.1 cation diffusion facilitator family transporter [Flavobacterium dauae]